MILRLRYALCLCFKPHFWVVYGASLAGAVGIAMSAAHWHQAVLQSFLAGYFELFGSIAFAMGIAHVLTVDYEEGVKEMLLSYPTPPLKLAAERIVAGFILAGVPFLLMAAAMQLYLRGTNALALGPSLGLAAILIDAAASWMFLAGLTLLATTLTEAWFSGLFVGGLYWVTELASGGQFTAMFFLFGRTFPSPTVLPDLNRLLLFGVGVIACLVSIVQFGRNRTRW